MSSRKGKGSLSNLASKGKSAPQASNSNVEHLTRDVADINLDSVEADDDGGWVPARKPKSKTGSSSSSTSWNSQTSNMNAWSQPNMVQNQGYGRGSGRASGTSLQTQTPDHYRSLSARGNPRPQSLGRSYVPPQPAIPPPLAHGWNWQSVAPSVVADNKEEFHGDNNDEDVYDKHGDEHESLDDTDDDGDDDDDDLLSDDDDSDSSQKSHEARKKGKWFKKFFDSLEGLTVEEINEPERQWHCPACQGGPGAIDWYKGLQPLMGHAKTKGSKRVKLHRELAGLLEEELRRRGTSVIPAGEVFGKWKGLIDDEKDHLIIWPPMVVIMNTQLEKDEKDDKWLGMGNQELLDCFSSYDAIRPKHSYGPQGHRGMSMLIFENSATGYFEAERLHRHFLEQGTDRKAWDSSHRNLFYPGGKRQLYGFMAVKEDLTFFNRHSPGKTKLKHELRSYQEMVVKQLKQMSEDNQLLMWMKNRVVKEQRDKKALKETFGAVTAKLRKTMEENHIVRERTSIQHQQNKEEMDFQEEFFKEQIRIIHEERDSKEENFEQIQQAERKRAEKSLDPSNTERRVEDKEMESFGAEREKLIKVREEKIAAMKKRHYEEEVELEKEFDAVLSQLMAKYTPPNAN